MANPKGFINDKFYNPGRGPPEKKPVPSSGFSIRSLKMTNPDRKPGKTVRTIILETREYGPPFPPILKLATAMVMFIFLSKYQRMIIMGDTVPELICMVTVLWL